MKIPTLLLSPDGSRDRNGPVTPTVVGDVQVVDGQYGNAWKATTTTSQVTVPAANYLNHDEMTILARFRLRSSGDTGYIYAAGSFSAGFVGMYNAPRNLSPVALRTANDGGEGDSSMAIHGRRLDPFAGEYVSSAVRLTPSSRQLRINDEVVNSSQGYVNREWMSGDFGFGHVAQAVGNELESVLIFPEALSDAEIERISNMPTAWGWASLMPVFSGVHVSYKPEPIAVSRRTPLEPIAVSRRMNTE